MNINKAISTIRRTFILLFKRQIMTTIQAGDFIFVKWNGKKYIKEQYLTVVEVTEEHYVCQAPDGEIYNVGDTFNVPKKDIKYIEKITAPEKITA